MKLVEVFDLIQHRYKSKNIPFSDALLVAYLLQSGQSVYSIRKTDAKIVSIIRTRLGIKNNVTLEELFYTDEEIEDKIDFNWKKEKIRFFQRHIDKSDLDELKNFCSKPIASSEFVYDELVLRLFDFDKNDFIYNAYLKLDKYVFSFVYKSIITDEELAEQINASRFWFWRNKNKPLGKGYYERIYEYMWGVPYESNEE